MNDVARLTALVRDSLDETPSPAELARRSAHSRSRFFRLFQALLEESPGAMRRRFLLERAAWELGRTKLGHPRKPVTDIALDAGYGSLEAFSRAFHKAYRVSPSLYRRSGAWSIHLAAPNEFHYCGPQAPHKGDNMDLYDLLAGTDTWYTRRLLEAATALDDEKLDRPLSAAPKVLPWDKPDQNLREILERIIFTKEIWAAALTGGTMPEVDNLTPEQRTPCALLERFNRVEAEYNRVLSEVRDRNAWSETFVDALCEPPETFTFGGVFAHVITFNTQRRLAALEAFQRLGVPVASTGCPSEYEATLK